MKNTTVKLAESELKTFTRRNFEAPSDCKNLEQIRFYIQELCEKIEKLESKFHYVPADAYNMLAQYNAKHNELIYSDFQKTYR
jgi:hypothetical protein